MSVSSAVIKAVSLLTFSLHSSSADTHYYQYFFTGVTPGINFPQFTAVGMLDGVQVNYYDSNIRKFVPRTEWIKKVHSEKEWNKVRENMRDEEKNFKDDVTTVMKRFNHTDGVHTWQWMLGCELHDDNSTRGYTQYGYDGEDFISLDLEKLTYTAAKPQAVITKNMWDPVKQWTSYMKDYLENICIKWLKKYVSYGRDTLERKDPPKASVFQKHSPSPEVVCHATGFFPIVVNITWRKDGEDVKEDVELRETLPNQDRSFQKRIILKVPAEDLQKHKYTCVIQHSSLKKEMVLELKDENGRTWIVTIVVIVLFLLFGVAVCYI